ncbi:MAG: Type 1 glutamine amidotransferase-like domain-containing protein [Actinomycetota bacterium]|nr:Type 1 glutamine amidotransferase-like domain-containing protein [Actinomycetota bacterium]
MMNPEALFDPIPEGAGAIGVLSSDEFVSDAEPFDRVLLSASGPRVAVILAADPSAARQNEKLALAHFRALGAEPVVLDVLQRDDATAQSLPPFDVLFLGGGSPATLLAALRDTPLWKEALRRWRAGASLAGSSAGAMALCRNCLTPQPGDRMPTQWSAGLGPLRNVALAVHASSRPESWLGDVAARAPVPVIALDDATGVVMQHGAAPVMAGPGRIRIA